MKLKQPKVKRVDEDVWSVEWGAMTTEFIIDICGIPAVNVYPRENGCDFSIQVGGEVRVEKSIGDRLLCLHGVLPYQRSVAGFMATDKEVRAMGKKKMSKKKGKQEKMKGYYAGKEVKAACKE